MDSPICSKRNARGARIEIYPRFGRIVSPYGDIVMEFAAAHVRDPLDRERWPVALPPRLPPDAIAIDRFGGYKPGRHSPHGIANRDLIAAIRAMKQSSVAHMQNDDNGCGAAVVATLTGASYAEAVERLYKGRGVRVLGTQRLAAATGTTCRRRGAETLAEAIKAGAVAALIRRDDARWGHYVAIKRGGVIVDPELVLKYPLAEYPRRGWRVVAWFVAE